MQSSWDQTPQTIIIVKLNFSQENALTAILNVFLTYEKIFLLYYSTAFVTNDTTIIHHDYKPDFSSLVSFLGHVCHQIDRRAGSSFLSGQWVNP